MIISLKNTNKMKQIFDYVFKALALLIGASLVYVLYLLNTTIKETSEVGRYQPFGSNNSLVIDTKTGHVTDSDY